MSDKLDAYERTKEFEKLLSPDRMHDVLTEYQDQFGKGFTLEHLMKLYDIKAKVYVGESIVYASELFWHWFGQAKRCGVFDEFMVSGDFSEIANGLERVAQAIIDADD